MVFQIVMLVGTLAGACLGGLVGRVPIRDPRKARLTAALVGAVLGFLVVSAYDRRPPGPAIPAIGTVVGAVLVVLLEFGLTATPRKPIPGPRHPLIHGDSVR